MKRYLLLIILVNNINAIDMPSFWRASLFQGEPGSDLRDFVSYVDVKANYGTASSGYDASGNTTNILNVHGLADVNKWANNLEGLQNGPTKPKTYQYLDETNGTIPALNLTGDNGKLEFAGKLTTRDITAEVRQNLKYGFYGKIHASFRRVKVDGITVTNKTNTQAAGAATFQSFLDDELDNVLLENGYDPITTPFNRDDLHDMAILAGWEGYSEDALNGFKSVRGGIATMLTLPVGSEEKLNRVVSIPLGYNGHWGLGARGTIQLHFADWFALGANAGVNVLLSKTTIKRMVTDKEQNGMVVLEKGNAEYDPGSIFDIAGYVKIDKPAGGIYAIAAYSFATQEKSRFEVKDSTFLSTLVASDSTNNKNDIANSDERIKQWYQHVAQFVVGYDFKAHTESNLAPKIEGFYSTPIFGKKAWKTDLVGGGGGLIINWEF